MIWTFWHMIKILPSLWFDSICFSSLSFLVNLLKTLALNVSFWVESNGLHRAHFESFPGNSAQNFGFRCFESSLRANQKRLGCPKFRRSRPNFFHFVTKRLDPTFFAIRRVPKKCPKSTRSLAVWGNLTTFHLRFRANVTSDWVRMSSHMTC